MNQQTGEHRLEVELIAITPDPERVIEQAGRTCYLSFDRIEDDSHEGFIRRLIKMGHESPLEHAYATFRIRNCSRAMTHQLVRHRLMAVSQQSQRYVDEEEFAYVVPESGASLDGEALIAEWSACLARYKVPRVVRVVEALPRNATGKIDRLRLRAMSTESGRK